MNRTCRGRDIGAYFIVRGIGVQDFNMACRKGEQKRKQKEGGEKERGRRKWEGEEVGRREGERDEEKRRGVRTESGIHCTAHVS